MSANYWKPNTTVAAVIEQDGKFLMIEERTREGLRINQPAGHLDPGESLLTAVAREALEETAHFVEPRWLIGVYMSILIPRDQYRCDLSALHIRLPVNWTG